MKTKRASQARGIWWFSPTHSSGLTNFKDTSASESMHVVKEVRFWLIVIMSDCRDTFVTFCRYAWRKGKKGYFGGALIVNFWRYSRLLPRALPSSTLLSYHISTAARWQARLCRLLKENVELKTLSDKLIGLQCSVREMLSCGARVCICRDGRRRNLVSFPGGARSFSLLQSFRTTSRAYYVGGGVSIKAAGREAYHSPASSAEVKNTWR
jgi:hypothetical protein